MYGYYVLARKWKKKKKKKKKKIASFVFLSDVVHGSWETDLWVVS